MITIHPKLWAIVRYQNPEDNLAYMTYYEENAKFEKRKKTGTNWANGYRWHNSKDKPITSKEFIYDNEPLEGFHLGDSVSRWSTDNKLFRVNDPRGFQVEVPTGNVSTLMQHTTIVNGVVQGKCAWGRDHNNHILLSVDSPPYKEIIEREKRVSKAKKHTIKDLQIGDMVTQKSEESYVYLGKWKFTYSIDIVWMDPVVPFGWKWAFKEKYDPIKYTETLMKTYEFKDKPTHVFVREKTWWPQKNEVDFDINNVANYDLKSSISIADIKENFFNYSVDQLKKLWETKTMIGYLPARISKQIPEIQNNRTYKNDYQPCSYIEIKPQIINIESKN